MNVRKVKSYVMKCRIEQSDDGVSQNSFKVISRFSRCLVSMSDTQNISGLNMDNNF